jgi:hypothetical protein
MVKLAKCAVSGLKECCGGLRWVQCDRCGRYELYENCGIDGEYDEDKVKAAAFVCRMCVLEEKEAANAVWMNGVNAWQGEVHERLNAMDECLASMGKSMSDVKEENVKAMKDECGLMKGKHEEQVVRVDVLGTSLSEVQERVVKLGDHLGVVEGNLSEMGVKQVNFEDLLEKVQKVTYASVLSAPKVTQVNGATTAQGSTSGAIVSVTRPSFAHQCAKWKEGTVILLGDSMARGVGQHLKADNLMFDKLDFSGSRIENIKDKVGIIGDKPDSHIALMVGTNNLKCDGTEEMMKKYSDLISEVKRRKYRQVSMVGILERRDTNRSMDIKRVSINRRLKALCETNGIAYLDVDIDGVGMLGRDGLHLNWRGCETVGKAIFKHAVSYLNLQ